MAAHSKTSLLGKLAAAVVAIGVNVAHGAEIKVIASNAIKEPYLELVPRFEKASGHKVVTTWSGTEAIYKKVSGGEVTDIVISASTGIDKLIAEGKLVADSRTSFAKVVIGAAVRSGLPKPDISSGEAVKNAVLSAKSVAYSSGTSGFHMADLFKKMGIADQIKDKVKQPPSGAQIGDLLARGEADLGFQQVSELIHVKGIDYLGPLPPDIQLTTVYSAGLHAMAPAPDAAKALVKFLTGPEAAAIIKNGGLEPG
jgi:molybdate transport system substrate-binding protein